MQLPITLYCHFPWCIEKCPYCDFNSYTHKSKDSFSDYANSLCQDLITSAKDLQRPIQAIFFGGGTPSLFPADELIKIIKCIKTHYQLVDNYEFTMEMNPNTHREHCDKLAQLRQSGINRLSIGAQSFNNQQLQRLGRTHQDNDIFKTYTAAQQAQFNNINIDIMYALPQQTLTECLDDLKQAIKINPSHLSWYCLTIEPNTYFSAHPPPLPDDENIYHMMQQGQALLQQNNYQHYEVSAFSQSKAVQCQHNLNYWTFGDYLGVGCGAHSKISNYKDGKLQVKRYHRHKTPKAYQLAPTTAVAEQQLSKQDLIFEYMLNHLRLKRPLDPEHFNQFTQLNFTACEQQLNGAVQNGLLIPKEQSYLISNKGERYLNDLMTFFL